jgi:diguanylate cyclase (GGDEF)-like protein/PAS domain S-box-containing protein
MAVYFGALFAAAIGILLSLWYFGLPQLGLVGAGAQRLNEAMHLLELAADQRRDAFTEGIRNRRGDIQVLAENKVISAAVKSADPALAADFERVVDRTLRAYPDRYRQLLIVDPLTHKVLASSQPGEVGSPFFDPDLIQRAGKAGIQELVEQVAGPEGSTLAILRQIQAPDRDGYPDGQMVGLFVAVLDARLFAADSRSASPAMAGQTLLFDSTGRRLAGMAGATTSQPDNSLVTLSPHVAPGFEGTLQETDKNDRMRVVVYRHLQLSGGQGWTLVHFLDQQEALSGLRKDANRLALMGLVLTLAALALIVLAAQRLTRPLRALSDVARQLGEGALTVRAPIQPAETHEIAALSETFNQMADSIQKSHKTLEERVAERTAELSLSEQNLRITLLSIGDAVIATDAAGCVSRMNATAERLTGWPQAEATGRPLAEVFQIYNAQTGAVSSNPVARVMASGEIVGLANHTALHARDGAKYQIADSAAPIRDASGQIVGVVLVFSDITDKYLTHAALLESEERWKFAIEGVGDGLWDWNMQTGEVFFSHRYKEMLGYADNEIGSSPDEWTKRLHPDDAPAVMSALQPYLDGKPGAVTVEFRMLCKDGHWQWTLGRVLVVSRDALGRPLRLIGTNTDITERKAHQSQLEHMAHFDALTGLPNRVLLADRLQQAMAQALRRGQQLAVAYLDLDGFKAINDRHGHQVGDQVLIALASRMKQALREGDTLARIGGDEFVAVLIDLENAAASHPMLIRLLAAAAEPIPADELMRQVSASIGVTFYPQLRDMDADQLLRQADQAMYLAKLAGKNRYNVFDAERDSSLRVHHESLENIRLALERREFVLYYQPKVNMRTGLVIGAEALIRWQHPDKGVLSPATFLPVIEDHPLAVAIGEWVISTALTQMEAWQAAGLDLSVSVNVGARQLQQVDFVARLQTLLANHSHTRPCQLELEVLETSALADIAQVSQVIDACAQMGVSFALDDFGTGYSSLTYLKRLQVALLKIDQSFVRDMLDDPNDMAILQGVIGLAAAFKRQVIAEGVETVAHGTVLLQLGCELAQGYGIARPMPADLMPAWAANWQPDPAWREVQQTLALGG